MKPRPTDVIGAALLTLVLFALVAVIFVSALGGDRPSSEEAVAPPETVALWQL